MFLPQWYQNPHQLHPFDLSLKGRLHQPRAKARPLSRRPGQTPQKMIGALEGRLKAANLQGVFGCGGVGGVQFSVCLNEWTWSRRYLMVLFFHWKC